ncbi:exodeoxyribonuclease VII large subunit [Lagierella sp.]|uniref:exodeoxyribonuclease VII large subunit n=1 Tax=Lagierella sp. TaxID=2849657 RepID=UPI00262EA2E6|nr:exodeoxyribonuclease VII large subunit [Lagierella sp.]
MKAKAFTVTEITKYIGALLIRDPLLNEVIVLGEISNFKKSGGNIYFSLKDETATIKCVVFRNMELSKNLTLSDGDKVSIRGSVITFDKGGYYQLLAKEVVNTGLGDIFKQYEKLKEKLRVGGYFDQIHKKKIPSMPENIGVVTSPTGAAVRDIITTIHRRFPIANIYVYPAIVQGVNAPKSLINGLNLLDSTDYIDLIIIGRGGGSFEDLNGFNDEELLMRIFESKKAIVSAVGHEVDNMLSDFVSDLRAPTPTAAGELVTPSLLDLIDHINNRMVSIERNYHNFFLEERKKLDYYGNVIKFHSPMEKIGKMKIETNRLKDRIIHQTLINLSRKKDRIEKFEIKLLKHNPSDRIKIIRDELNNLNRIISIKILGNIERERLKLKNFYIKIQCHDDDRIKKLGYIRVSSQDKYIRSLKGLSLGDLVKLHFEDGTATSEIRSIENGK